MLEILVNGQKLDLPGDIQINLTIENPFPKLERIPVPYSLAFELPGTANNLRIFNYPNRQAAQLTIKNYSCIIRFQGLNITAGVLTLGRFDKSIKANFRGADLTDNLSKKLYEMKLQDYTLGNKPTPEVDINFNSGPGLNYKTLMQNAVNSNNGKFIVAPVRVSGEDWQTGVIRRKNIGYPDSSADSMYLNFYNAKAKNWMLSDAIRTIHTSNFPFLYIHYLIDEILGESLVNNPFKTGDLSKLVLITSFHPNWKNKGLFPIGGPKFGMLDDPSADDQYHIFLETRMPALESKEFVKELVKLFGYTLVPIQGKFYLKSNDSILNKSVQGDWSRKLIDKKTIDIEPKKTFNYGYDGDTQEQMDLPSYAKVTNYTAIANYSFRSETQDGETTTLQVAQTGEVWDLVKDGTGKTYEKRTSGFGSKNEGDNVFDLKVKLKPLELSFDKYWWVRVLGLEEERPEMKDWMVPIYDGERTKRESIGNIMFYNGVQNTYGTGDSYPYLSPHNISPSGIELGDLSLYWEGPRGLIQNFHTLYKEWIEKDKLKVTSEALLTALDLQSLDITDKVHIDGRNFFIEKIQVTIRHNRIDPAIVDFIEA